MKNWLNCPKIQNNKRKEKESLHVKRVDFNFIWIRFNPFVLFILILKREEEKKMGKRINWACSFNNKKEVIKLIFYYSRRFVFIYSEITFSYSLKIRLSRKFDLGKNWKITETNCV